MLCHADDQPAQDIDHHDEQARHRVAADELACAIHGAVELGLLPHFGPALARILLADQARIQIGVDRHLLARHRIQRETGAHFGDPARALGDHDEIDDHQDDEHYNPDRKISADQKVPEGLDDVSGRRRPPVPVEQHHSGRGHVQRQAKQRGEQQHRRKGGEVQRLAREHGH
ncbi:hypothetical protein CDEF62S_05134 [Castellaniella defragrans]